MKIDWLCYNYLQSYAKYFCISFSYDLRHWGVYSENLGSSKS